MNTLSVAGARLSPCPTCHGTGKIVLTVDDGDDELERAFRRLEIERYAKPYEEARDCQNCGTPYLRHRAVTPTHGYFCTTECFLEYLNGGEVPLVLRRAGGG